MSTKIYTGFEFSGAKPSRLFHDFLKVAEEFRKFAKEKVHSQIRDIMASYIVNKIDRISCGISEIEKPDKSIFWDAENYVRDGIKKAATSTTWTGFDFEVSAVVFPVKRRMVGIFYGAGFFEDFLKLPGITDYHYQNQTDPPEDVPARAWRKRAKDWDEVLGDSYIPSENGYVVEIIPKNYSSMYAVYDCQGEFNKLFAEIKLETRIKDIAYTMFERVNKLGWLSTKEIEKLDLSEYESLAKEKLIPQINMELVTKTYKEVFNLV